MTKNFKLLLEEAHALGLTTDIVYPEKEVVRISDGHRSIIVKELFSFANDAYSASAVLAKNKEITYRFWEQENIPFPRSRYFKDATSFSHDAAALDLQFPVVFKKSNGKKSVGIRTNIKSFEELSKIVADSDGSFIIQEMVFGKEYRVLVYKDRLLGALELVPPQIIGNGIDTIETLIQKKNTNLQKKILLNEKVMQTLEKNNLTLNTVPEKDTCISLQENSCLAEGGSSIDCTDIIHEDMLELVRKSARVVNMKLAGIDIICEDISIDPRKQKVSFLETNSSPSLSIHYDPTVGKSRPVIKDILQDIFGK